MYKLLIVDDEPLVQVGIKSMLPWQDLGISICGIAANGKAAFEMIENDMPDIVISDIKMPIMSGLELAKKCQEIYEEQAPAFIILTSYEDFSLAREALTYRVSDYLVKLDLTPDMLKASIEKIIKRFEKEQKAAPSGTEPAVQLTSYHDKFFIRLLCNLFVNHEQFVLQQKELKLEFNSASYICCYCELVSSHMKPLDEEGQINLFHTAFQMSSNLLSKYHKCHMVTLDLHHFAVIFCFDDTQDAVSLKAQELLTTVSNALTNYYNVYLRAGIGTVALSTSQIAESYQYSKNAFTAATRKNCIEIFDPSSVTPKDSFNFAIIKDDLTKAFEEYDADTLYRTLTEFVQLFQSNPNHFLQAMDFASSILFLSISMLPNGEQTINNMFPENPQGYRALYQMSGMDQVLSYLTHLRDQLCLYFSEKKKEIRKPIVAQVKRYIKEHVTDHLSLAEVAAVFGISPNYLSQLFKKYNDVGFNDYVTNCKINEAKHLLSNGDYKVYEVAEILGFESAFYFSKVFKKVVGVPPTEFTAK